MLFSLVLPLFTGTLAVFAQPQPTPPSAAASSTTLTNAVQIRALSLTEAQQEFPVRLHAVVNAIGDETGTIIFIEDVTGGTFMITPARDPALQPGTEIDLVGKTYAEFFMPGVRTEKLTITGRRKLPPAVPANYDDLLTGLRHYERAVLDGVVRTVLVQTNRVELQLAMGTRRVDVWVYNPDNRKIPPLVDSRVRVTGVVKGKYLHGVRRQLVAPRLDANSLDDLEIVRAASIAPFDEPVLAVSQLLNFDPSGNPVHRVKVRGVVTHQIPMLGVYLRDEARGLFVQARQKDIVKPGDVLEVVGFPSIGQFNVFLEDASFRKVGTEHEPVPVVTKPAHATRGVNEADLVTLQARLLEVLTLPKESLLVLSSGDIVFHARLESAAPSLRNGSVLKLTGVCRTRDSGLQTLAPGGPRRPLELLLRSAADIVVVGAPPWWTAQRIAISAASLLALAVAAIAWGVTLRRKVAQQTTVIRRQVEREAVMEERQRVAREVHDALAQSFSGLGFQLETLSALLPPDSPPLKARLETAKQMVRYGQEEFRRSLIKLRSTALDQGGLAEALRLLGQHSTSGTDIALAVNLKGASRRLNEDIEGNLMRIGQECITNAVRHAKPRHIDVNLEFGDREIALSIIDDGKGFDPESLKTMDNGHLGWRGIHERARQIGGAIKLVSQPGRGTGITVTVPA